MQEVFLNPGDFWFGQGVVRVRTLLGSCVSIILWHPSRHIGGMCHFMLPSRSAPRSGDLDGRYADEAMELFSLAVRQHKADLHEFQAKLFGGGSMFPEHTSEHHLTVADRNIAAARQLLGKHGLTVYAEHVGGVGHRRLIFDVWTGEVRMGYGETLRNARNSHSAATRNAPTLPGTPTPSRA